MNNNLKKTIVAALFAALTCVATVIMVSLPLGYANLGDVTVLFSAAVLGPIYGSLAAGIGSALADLFVGYAMYVPGTFVIKLLMALVAAGFQKSLSNRLRYPIASYVLSAFAAELVMVGGYYLYEAVFLAYGFAGATASLPGNCIQGAVGITIFTLLIMPVRKLMRKMKIEL